MSSIDKLVVTLVRGLAGKRQYHKDVLKALGLRKRFDCAVLPNSSPVRGSLDKVKHLVSVETGEQFAARQRELCQKLALREPIVVKH